MRELIEKVREQIRQAKQIAVLTGAGISAESGVPTFRGADGLWRNKDPMKLASIQGFLENPKEVWEFYNWRREVIAKVTYNKGHKALVELEKKKENFLLITQNVDGLHSLAGSKKVLEIHGNIWWVKCTKCYYKYEDRTPNLGELPTCPKCGGLLRPGVVFFGEPLDSDILDKCCNFLKHTDLMLIIGTSSVVEPAASLGFIVKKAGGVLVEINLEPTPNTKFMDYAIHGKAGEILPGLIEGL